jgi:ElaB/YqjD/DUF883 family membrane-anchored ribosome-binding protein
VGAAVCIFANSILWKKIMSVSEHKTVEEQWQSVRERIAQRWPQLTKEELTSIDGDSRKLIALIQQRTGDTLSHIEEEIDRVAEQSYGLLQRVSRSARQATEESARYLQEGYTWARDGVSSSVQQAPATSVGIAFAAGTLLGTLIGMSLMRSLTPPPKHYGWYR